MMSERAEEKKNMVLHWLVVGYVSPGAAQWIKDAGGQVIALAGDFPHLVAVGIAYDPDGAWTWSHGRQQYRQGIEFWSNGEIQEASTSINLLYGNMDDPHVQAEYCSMETNYLILPDEEFDPAVRRVVERGMYISSAGISTLPADDALGDLDDAPF